MQNCNMLTSPSTKYSHDDPSLSHWQGIRTHVSCFCQKDIWLNCNFLARLATAVPQRVALCFFGTWRCNFNLQFAGFTPHGFRDLCTGGFTSFTIKFPFNLCPLLSLTMFETRPYTQGSMGSKGVLHSTVVRALETLVGKIWSPDVTRHSMIIRIGC